MTTYDVEVMGWLKGKKRDEAAYINKAEFMANDDLQLLRLIRDAYDSNPHLAKWRLVKYAKKGTP